MNIEITALAAGTLVFLSIAILAMVMALRLRTIRKKNKEKKRDKEWKESKAKTVEENEFKANPEQNKVSQEQPKEHPKEQPKNEPIDSTSRAIIIDFERLPSRSLETNCHSEDICVSIC